MQECTCSSGKVTAIDSPLKFSNSIAASTETKALSNGEASHLIPEVDSDSFTFSPSYPLEAFLYYFDATLLDKIIRDANFNSVKDRITKEELLTFLGVNAIISVHKVFELSDFWSPDDCRNKIVKNIMSYERFTRILNTLQSFDCLVSDVKNQELSSLNLLIEHLNMKFYTRSHNEHLSMGHKAITCSGSTKEYKLLCLFDHEGFIYRFKLLSEESIDENVVADLVGHLDGASHKICISDYFSSLSLFDYLKAIDIQACGMARIPSSLTRDMFCPGKSFFETAMGTSVWEGEGESEGEYFISNFHKETCFGRSNFPYSNYYKQKNSVDNLVALKPSCISNVKGVTLWQETFIRLLNVTFFNSYILYKNSMKSNMTFVDFLKAVGTGLTSQNVEDNSTGVKHFKSKYSVPDSIRLTQLGVHWPVFNARRGKRCEVCYSKGQDSKPTSYCSHCLVPLCCNHNKNCFVEYHS